MAVAGALGCRNGDSGVRSGDVDMSRSWERLQMLLGLFREGLGKKGMK